MATTSGNLVAGKPSGGRGTGGKGDGRRDLKAKLATGGAILGCATALAIGGVRVGNAAHSQPANAPGQQAASGNILSPSGRTGPADEYQQVDFTIARQLPQRTGPADEYGQAEVAGTGHLPQRTGPADEYDR